jgi:hypothetical protein
MSKADKAPVPETWSFTYDGPVEAEDSRLCELCNAASSKVCGKASLQHGPTPDSCASCDAAKHGHCANHCGLAAALSKHEELHKVESQETFDLVSGAVVQYVEALPSDVKRIYVKAYGFKDLPDSHYASLRLEIEVFK